MLNAYPLVHRKSVYEGQRAAAPDQRVFILTRSASPASSATARRSGRATSPRPGRRCARRSRPASASRVSGMPYWTMDIGGFSVPERFATAHPRRRLEEWRELNTRWFEFGAFVPLLRVHGEAPKREMWESRRRLEPAPTRR